MINSKESNVVKDVINVIDPFVDWGFKRIFGEEVNKDLLIDFLQNLLINEKKIVDLTYHDKELLSEDLQGRGCVLDIKCRDENGDEYIIEMQNMPHNYFDERVLYYHSRLIQKQKRRGSSWDNSLKGVYVICFLNFTMPDYPNFRTDIVYADENTHQRYFTKHKLIFLQFPKLQINKSKNCSTNYEKWLFLLKIMHSMKKITPEEQYLLNKKIFQRLIEVANVESLSEQEREKYELELEYSSTYLSVVDTAEQKGFDKGVEQGIVKGIEQGIEQGITQGIAKGREEGREEGLEEGLAKGLANGLAKGEKLKALEIAKSMKALGIDSDLIQKSTGLSIAEIES